MKNFINKALKACRNYTLWDWGWLKITLFSCGMLVGTYFFQFLFQYINFIWGIFIFSYIWVAYRTFVKYWNRDA